MPNPLYKLIRGNSMVQMKNYYLLTLLQNDNEVKKLLESDTALASIAKNKLNGLLQSKTACSNNVLCYTDRMQFTEQEISNVSARLTALYAAGNPLAKLVQQAVDFEPMTETVNKEAFNRVKTIKWDAYPYSVILVPGAGPEDPKVALSAEGMLRCRLAAIQYKKGVAPFIVVSGGKVHPYKTIYSEALEMKKFLIEKLNIPENVTIMEPHARHTTTNMRNCVRLIFRYGMPIEKPCISTTTAGQSMMITTTLAARCQKELNEVPFKAGKRLSETEAEFIPVIDALHINPAEPLDP